MTRPVEPPAPEIPFPIFRISSTIERYLLYDIDVITWLRKTHHILGVLIGTLPQIPQQNVFLGLPLELMPEEARLLVEKRLAYVVDDLDWHQNGIRRTTPDDREAFKRDLAKKGREAAKAAERKKLESTERAMRRLRLESTPARDLEKVLERGRGAFPESEDSDSLFAPAISQRSDSPSVSDSQASMHQVDAWTITPKTSYPPLPTPPIDPVTPLPNVKTPSFALFKHLHAHDYYMSPGLRFGCQFLVYPGDPLRFHSHFLAMGFDWDEEINLLDLVGGGRLGTGVKKGWLIGGPDSSASDKYATVASKDPSSDASREEIREDMQGDEEINDAVRTFCIEWGGM